jgi:hypothetical protein
MVIDFMACVGYAVVISLLAGHTPKLVSRFFVIVIQEYETVDKKYHEVFSKRPGGADKEGEEPQ